MLWQPSLPEVYRRLSSADLALAISRARQILGQSLVILGHHYQADEVIRHADVTGDSLKLSQIAAGLREKQPVAYVIFCGVHFMAETADMLTPDDVAVILPDLSAGCSMADMAQYDDALDAWTRIHDSLNESHADQIASRGTPATADANWFGRVIPITYVNSSAAIKAFVGDHGGACCTSSNAKHVLAWAFAGGTMPPRTKAVGQTEKVQTEEIETEEIKVLFLPDQHLGRNTAHALGVDVAKHACLYDPKRSRAGDLLGGSTAQQIQDAKVILWAGHCSVHKLFRPEHCDQVRSRAEGTQILVHPECAKEVVDLADLNGSTEFIINTIRAAKPGTKWAVGTEVHLVARLAKEAAARDIHVAILSDCQCLCTTMYRIDEPHLLWVLDHLTGDSQGRLPAKYDGKPLVINQVRVHPEARAKALLSIDRMLSITVASAANAANAASNASSSSQIKVNGGLKPPPTSLQSLRMVEVD